MRSGTVEIDLWAWGPDISPVDDFHWYNGNQIIDGVYSFSSDDQPNECPEAYDDGLVHVPCVIGTAQRNDTGVRVEVTVDATDFQRAVDIASHFVANSVTTSAH